MDETALPILLVDLAHREKALAEADMARFWPMVRKAAGYLAAQRPGKPGGSLGGRPGLFAVAQSGQRSLHSWRRRSLADLNHEPAAIWKTADTQSTSIRRE